VAPAKEFAAVQDGEGPSGKPPTVKGLDTDSTGGSTTPNLKKPRCSLTPGTAGPKKKDEHKEGSVFKGEGQSRQRKQAWSRLRALRKRLGYQRQDESVRKWKRACTTFRKIQDPRKEEGAERN